MVTVIDYIETFIGDFDWLVGKQKRVNRTCWAISKESKSFRQLLDNDQLGHGFVGQTVPHKFVLCRFIHVHFNAKFRTFSFGIKTWLSWVISNNPLMKPSFGFSFIISSFNDFRWEENYFKKTLHRSQKHLVHSVFRLKATLSIQYYREFISFDPLIKHRLMK